MSGPEPHRSSLEDKIRSQLKSINGSVVFSLGKLERKTTEEIDGVKIFSSLPAKERNVMLNRSKLVVSRSGYSTLMDICTVGAKALFIPTPNQPEQEYIARYHKEKETFHSSSQNELDLKSDIETAMRLNGLEKDIDVKKSVENAMKVFFSGEKKDF